MLKSLKLYHKSQLLELLLLDAALVPYTPKHTHRWLCASHTGMTLNSNDELS